jgi:type III secretion system (T3SS) SseB-like protein
VSAVLSRAGGAETTVVGVLGHTDSKFAADDGSAEPAAAAALAAFAAGTGSEHAALTALAGARLLVPVVAAEVPDGAPDGRPPQPGASGGSCHVPGGEKTSEMSIPTLMGQDGRPAVPAFTSLAAMHAWQPGARPVPADAARVWQAAAADSAAVVLDIAGPVPLAIDGARLAALAAGQPVPHPEHDPDVQAAIGAVAATYPQVTAVRLAGDPAGEGPDLTVELSLAPGASPAIAGQLGSEVLGRLGSRLRRGLAVTIVPPGS